MSMSLSRGMSRLFCGVAASAVALAASPALGAEAAAAESTEIGEVVVVGVTKQAALVQDVPTAITAYSGDDLEAQGVKEVRDIAKFTPGFVVREAGNNPTAFSLSMRGQVQNDNLATLEPSVGVYLDEMYVARGYGLNTDLLDIKSAQVLKGPQGTLFGRNTSAGAVLLQTNDPEFGEYGGSARVTFGRFNQGAGTAVLNLGVGETFAVRGALYYERRGAYQRDVRTGQGYGDRRTVDGRVKAAFKPVENVLLQISGEWFDGKIDGPAFQNRYFNLGGAGFDPAAPDRALFGDDRDKVAVTQPSQTPGTPSRGLFNDIKTQTYIAKATVGTAFGELKWINGYRKIEGANLIDLDGSSQTTGNHSTQGFQNLKQWSSELQLTGSTLNDALSYAFGGTYLREKGTDDSRSSVNGSAVWTGFSGDLDNDSYGAYAQLHYKLNDALGLTAGIRYSHDKKGVTTQSAAFPNNGATIAACLPNPAQLVNGVPIISVADYTNLLANQCRRGRSDSFNNVSYTVGVDYKPTEDILLYAKQSRGYRSGAQQLRTLTLTDTAPAEPEIVNEQEIGLKSEWMDGRLRFNLSGYHNKIKGAQRSVILAANGISQTILENADIETWGGEGEATFRLAAGLEVFAGGALTDPKYTTYNGFVVAGGVLTPSDKTDTQFVGVVRKQLTLGVNYNRDLGFARLDANVSYAWQGKMSHTEQNIARLTRPAAQGGAGITSTASAQALLDAAKARAYGVTNARVTLSFGPDDNYEVAVFGRNIFDERVANYALYLGGLNYVGVRWNEPATYGVSATVKF